MMFVGNLSDVRCTAAALAPGYGLAVALSLALTAAPAQGGSITHVEGFTVDGDEANDQFGGFVSGAGDVNNDGFDDVIVAAPAFDLLGGDGDGYARVFSGDDGSVLHTFNRDDQTTQFGRSVSGVGDVNGDSHDDLVVAGTFDSGIGFVSVFSGSDGNTVFTIDGGYPNAFGASVSGAGDVNGDGTPDLIVGAPGDGTNGTGSARVFSGEDQSELFTFNGDDEKDNFGTSVSGAGDVNDDGFDDLIVGTITETAGGGTGNGYARVFSGDDGSVLHTFKGDTDDLFGESVSGAGDVNDDGFDDLIVGAFGDDDGGSARVFSGEDGSELFTFISDSGDEFGGSVSGAGDVNGDGYDDLIVGDIGDPKSGSARVFSGEDGSELFTFNGDADFDRFGASVSGAGDVNGDGIADFIVGTLDIGSNDGGYARVFTSQTVIPEPTAAALIALGGTLLLRRRSRLAE